MILREIVDMKRDILYISHLRSTVWRDNPTHLGHRSDIKKVKSNLSWRTTIVAEYQIKVNVSITVKTSRG